MNVTHNVERQGRIQLAQAYESRGDRLVPSARGLAAVEADESGSIGSARNRSFTWRPALPDLMQGGVDHVLLGGGAQMSGGLGEGVVVHVDHGPGHVHPPID
jgi:hypothetical protein